MNTVTVPHHLSTLWGQFLLLSHMVPGNSCIQLRPLVCTASFSLYATNGRYLSTPNTNLCFLCLLQPVRHSGPHIIQQRPENLLQAENWGWLVAVCAAPEKCFFHPAGHSCVAVSDPTTSKRAEPHWLTVSRASAQGQLAPLLWARGR